jgi:hypothetical protein
MKFLICFLLSFNLFAATDEGPVSLTGTAHRQITTFDIAGKPGDAPTAYKVKLRVKDYNLYTDGSVEVKGSKKYSFVVGNLVLDSEGNPDPVRVKLMEDFVALFYEEVAKHDLKASPGR